MGGASADPGGSFGAWKDFEMCLIEGEGIGPCTFWDESCSREVM